jgi:hypothetical protein
LLKLQAKGLKEYVGEECIKPEDKASVEWRILNHTNSLVASWLLTSVSPTIASMIESINSAAKV